VMRVAYCVRAQRELTRPPVVIAIRELSESGPGSRR
jgi:hypothetical protein